MVTMEELRESVTESLKPEIDMFTDNELRQKVIDAWALSLSETEFKSLDELSCSTMIGDLYYPGATQAHHQRGVGRLARGMAETMIEMHGKDIRIDPDLALAGGICHDLGKPFFYDRKNRERWLKNKAYTGHPPYRHTMKGAFLALQAGLPEEVVHTIATHDYHMDGQYVQPSVYTDMVYRADWVYWRTLIGLGLTEKLEPVEGLGEGECAG